LEESKKLTDEALKEILKLKQELKASKDETDRLRIQKAYISNTDILTAEEWLKKT
jgi:hypothetical protein